jgi:hypothetical protein
LELGEVLRKEDRRLREWLEGTHRSPVFTFRSKEYTWRGWSPKGVTLVSSSLSIIAYLAYLLSRTSMSVPKVRERVFHSRQMKERRIGSSSRIVVIEFNKSSRLLTELNKSRSGYAFIFSSQEKEGTQNYRHGSSSPKISES